MNLFNKSQHCNYKRYDFFNELYVIISFYGMLTKSKYIYDSWTTQLQLICDYQEVLMNYWHLVETIGISLIHLIG
jgi:hypothetical protein